MLDPAGFDALREHDHDIDLQRLQVAHRTDFICAYLLAHFGGLWIDADCLLMCPPNEVFDRLAKVDFVAHRDRQGWAARAGSRLARALYERICARLRAGASLGWTSLGSQPLTEILRSTKVPWHEIECQRVQPVCWSTPEVFFERSAATVHEARMQPNALCYMLSNTEVRKYCAGHPGENLLTEDTFFSFLLARALREVDAPHATAVRSLCALPFAIECLEATSPSQVLQIGTDSVLWGTLVREWWREHRVARVVTRDTTHLAAVRLPDGADAAYGLDVFDRVYASDQPLPSHPTNATWGLIVLTAAATRQSPEWLAALLPQALDAAAYVFAPADPDTLYGCVDGLRARVVREGCDAVATPAGLLLSRDDARGLYRPSAAQLIFERWFREAEARADESLSGPGSSLAQTAELHQRLPLLLQHIGARSLLDAPCGDFNWMQHVDLGVDRHVGVDIVSALIAHNGERHGSPTRRFELRDIMRELLPQAEVILCRDCLVHFSFADIRRTLRNFERCGARYLLTTTFPRVGRNPDIETGDWRPLNFGQAPFHFPKPLALINEKCTESQGRYADKSLGLWRLSDVVSKL